MVTPSAKKSILVAEDEQDLREALAMVLKDSGYEVIEAHDGDMALQMALAQHPDLILLDLHMPHRNGHEVLEALRQDSWGREVFVIILTAQSDMQSVSDAVLHGGMNMEYLVKTDWKLEDVIAKVQEKIGA